VTIQGDGATATTIDAHQVSRVLQQGVGQLTLSQLGMVNGQGVAYGVAYGGAIIAGGSVDVDNGLFQDNQVVSATDFARGGAIYAGDVTVSATRFERNTAVSGGPGTASGGAIFSRNTADVQASLFTANGAGSGGAIYARGPLTLVGTKVEQNACTGPVGGGIASETSVSVTGGAITDNNVVGRGKVLGGGIYSAGSVTLSGTLVARNFVQGSGGGTPPLGGGVYAQLDVTVRSSTVTGNRAGFLGIGGGIYSAWGTVTVVNSTISGNSAGTDPNTNSGGGIWAPSVILEFATVAGNVGGPGANISAQSLQSAASVVAYASGGAGCAVGATSSAGYSYDDDGSCGFTAAHDVSAGADPMLGAPDDNGGPTPTMHPTPGSPLADAIPAGSCTGCQAADQRGIARPQGGAFDIGAVEAVAAVAVSPRFTS
jgi:predicted outer membrane repeat protein